MSGVNKVILIGHVGKDPEVKYLEGGTAVAKFSLATSESYKDKQGNKVDTTEWHNIVMWRQLAELAEKYIRKGKLLYIEGKIKTRTYGEGDNKKYFTEIIADEMTFLGSKADGGGSQLSSGSTGMDTSLPAATNAPTDDLPF
jgi:single-strand DNA-binding protein